MTTPDQPTPEAVLALAATTFGDALMRQLDEGKALLLAVDAVWSVAIEAAEKAALAERERGVAEGLKRAATAVRAQAGLPDLVHFDRPSDFRKGVLTCLAALEALESKTADPLADDPVARRLGLVDADGQTLCRHTVGAPNCTHRPAEAGKEAVRTALAAALVEQDGDAP